MKRKADMLNESETIKSIEAARISPGSTLSLDKTFEFFDEQEEKSKEPERLCLSEDEEAIGVGNIVSKRRGTNDNSSKTFTSDSLTMQQRLTRDAALVGEFEWQERMMEKLGEKGWQKYLEQQRILERSKG